MTINVFEDDMIDAAAYGPDDDRPDSDDMPDVAGDRIDDHLAAIDAADLWPPEPTADQFAPSFDEWNAIRGALGQLPGTFSDYLADIGRAVTTYCNPIVGMLARRWASESNGAGELPADWNMTAEVPF